MNICKCGKEIKSSIGKSCVSCSNTKRATKHNLSKSKLYSIWSMMKQRCGNPNSKKFKYYGGRGITVCSEWTNSIVDFNRWALDNGYKEGLELDRKNNDGNYEPNNCRFVDRSLQMQNTRISTRNTSGYRGVYYEKERDRYVCRVTHNKKNKYIGRFKTAKEAGKAYNKYVLENKLSHILNEV